MFDSFDTDRNGKIDAGELGRALAYYQYVGSPTTLCSFTKRRSARLDVPSHILGMVIEKYGESSN
jgi:Ca2+-binding EF-hand superfamily protein